MKDDLLYLIHIVEHGQKIVRIAQRTSREAFDRSEETQYALTHLLQIIGEAATKVRPETKASFPSIPWPQIVNMRHRIVHDYSNITLDIVWVAATDAVPHLLSILEPYVEQLTKERGLKKP